MELIKKDVLEVLFNSENCEIWYDEQQVYSLEELKIQFYNLAKTGLYDYRVTIKHFKKIPALKNNLKENYKQMFEKMYNFTLPDNLLNYLVEESSKILKVYYNSDFIWYDKPIHRILDKEVVK